MFTPTFVNPKNDYAFKLIFGSKGNESHLISFLNSMLYTGRSVISQVSILNPYLPGKVESLKETYVDIHAVLNDGTIVIIEMQMNLKPVFFERVLYNVAKKYSNQLEKAKSYSKLRPTIGLIIANFSYLASDNEPINRFEFLESSKHFPYPGNSKMTLSMVELPKFDKSIQQVESPTDMWLYFLRHADELEEIPKEMAEINEINSAFDQARIARLTPTEADEIEKRERYAADQAENLRLTKEQAIREGREEGRVKGREEGITYGLQTLRLTLIELIQARFGSISRDLLSQIHQIDKFESIQSLIVYCATAVSLNEVEVAIATRHQ